MIISNIWENKIDVPNHQPAGQWEMARDYKGFCQTGPDLLSGEVDHVFVASTTCKLCKCACDFVWERQTHPQRIWKVFWPSIWNKAQHTLAHIVTNELDKCGKSQKRSKESPKTLCTEDLPVRIG